MSDITSARRKAKAKVQVAEQHHQKTATESAAADKHWRQAKLQLKHAKKESKRAGKAARKARREANAARRAFSKASNKLAKIEGRAKKARVAEPIPSSTKQATPPRTTKKAATGKAAGKPRGRAISVPKRPRRPVQITSVPPPVSTEAVEADTFDLGERDLR